MDIFRDEIDSEGDDLRATAHFYKGAQALEAAKAERAIALKQEGIIHSESAVALSGALLQLPKQTISFTHGSLNKCTKCNADRYRSIGSKPLR
jgi:hypothetical protein